MNEYDKVVIGESEDGLKIELKAVGKKWQLYALTGWLLLWTFCGIAVFLYLTQSNGTGDSKVYFLVWFSFWLYFEYMAIKAFLWRRNGKEQISVVPGKLIIERKGGIKPTYNSYDISQIKSLRLSENTKKNLLGEYSKAYWYVGGETIIFDYYGKEIGFAMQIGENEAANILKKVKYHLKLQAGKSGK